MTNYSLIEFKLRRFIYLGEKTSIYVPPVHQKEFWKHKNRQDFKITGLKLIGDIIKKNKTEDIDSIIPIISKIAKENKIQNYENLIYLLAVCTKFNLENCRKMKTDAYAMVITICIDGLKLLMFYKFCNTAAELLYKNGYISEESSGFGGGTQRVLRKWYLNREPLETIKAIMKHKTYKGVNHRHVINTCHLHSKDPGHQVYITYILHGLKIMIKIYEQKLMIKDNDSREEKLSKTLQLYVYNYIKNAHRVCDSTNNSKLAKDLKWNNVGKDYEIVVSKMLKSPKVLANFVKQLPLKTLLDNTYSFARHRLFQNETGNKGCMEFILRFNNYKAIQESEIHPIQPYLEYLRYTRSGCVIYSINKKKKFQQNMLFDTINDGKGCNNNIVILNKKHEKWIESTKKGQRKFCIPHVYFMKPVPEPSSLLTKFLSTDLVKITLNNLNPSGRRLLIAYDSRTYYMNSINCYHMHVKFLKVFEAVTLIIQSITYPNLVKANNKPTICALTSYKFKMIDVDYELALSTESLENYLFGESSKKLNKNNRIRNVKPLTTLQWSKKHNQKFDVFVFLGTHKMDLKRIRKAKANYEAFSNSKIKIIVCCLNGNHTDRVELSRDGLLFIPGFDKNVGKIIELFINNRF